MPRNKDLFSDIKLSDDVGLDQRLFQQGNDDDTKQRDGVTNNERASVPTGQRAYARTGERANAGPGQRGNARAKDRTGEATVARSSIRRSRRVRVETTSPTAVVGVAMASQRISGRHAYDIFLDQVKWMNRLKLEMEETYGKRISGNDIVKLSLDLVIDDYNRNGESSKLFKTLILGEPASTRSAARSGTGGEGDDG